MQLRIKRLRDVPLPAYQTDGAAGIDLCFWPTGLREGVYQFYPDCDYKLSTGLLVEIPEGHVGLMLPRSSHRKDFYYFHTGTIDSDFRGEMHVCFRPSKRLGLVPGERIAQLVIIPCPRFEIVEADELSETARGAGGFGSTGSR